MAITFAVARTTPRGVDAIGVPVATDGAVPRAIGLGRATLTSLGFDGKLGQTLVLPQAAGPVVIAVGVGERAKVTAAVLRTAAAALARAGQKRTTISTVLADADGVNARDAAQAVAEGVTLASYRFTMLKTDKTAPAIQTVTLVGAPARLAALDAGAQRGAAIADAVCLARDLANTPPSHLTARMMADQAVELAKASGLDVHVLDEHAMAELGLGGMLGVNRGSTEPPRLVKLTYTPRGGGKGHVGLVGKGVMFDSGGLSLKPSDSMITMKMDMTGAAVVLATMSLLKALKVKAKVTGWLCLTDNRTGGDAMAVGDVLKMRNGKTVEVQNTDAEGRLILADGLSLAIEDEVDAVLDIATLTGAAMGALGLKYAALLSNHDALAAQVLAAAGRADENLWRLPIVPEYRKLLDSTVADMRNIGGPYGGAIIASLFLQEFVGRTPWAHLDIAGPMNTDADDGWLTRGASAYGVRTFVEMLESYEPV